MRTPEPPPTSPGDGRALVQLTPDECLPLLASGEVGRVVYTEGALPAVTPVNYALLDGRIVFRTGEESRLANRIPGTIVAFQVDDLDRRAHTGWSVVVTGNCERIADPARIASVEALALAPWAPGERPVVIEVGATLVTGVRITLTAGQLG